MVGYICGLYSMYCICEKNSEKGCVSPSAPTDGYVMYMLVCLYVCVTSKNSDKLMLKCI